MDHRLLDRLGLLAIVLYILGALSYYLPLFFGSRASAPLALELFFLFPPVFAGAAAYQIVRYRRESEFTPSGLAAASLGAGLVVGLAWKLLHFGLAQYNRAYPPSELPKHDLGPEFLLIIPYMLLCAVLSIVAAFALPKLIRLMLRGARI